MAVAINSSMPSGTGHGANPGTSDSYSFTNTAGTVLYAIVCYGSVASTSITSPVATYNGVSMALVTSTVGGTGAESLIALFRLLSPATGANTFATSATYNAGSSKSIVSGLTSFTGNDGTTPETQTTTAATVGTTATVTLSGVTSMTLAGVGCGTSLSAPTQTAEWNNNLFSGNSMGNGRASTSTATGSVSHSYTIGGSDTYGAVIVEIKAGVAAVAAQAFQPHRMPLGV